MFLIGSFSYLQVTMTCMRAWMSSKFGRIRPQTTELAALELMKKIFFIFAGNEDIHKSLDEFKIRPDATTGFHGNTRTSNLRITHAELRITYAELRRCMWNFCGIPHNPCGIPQCFAELRKGFTSCGICSTSHIGIFSASIWKICGKFRLSFFT